MTNENENKLETMEQAIAKMMQQTAGHKSIKQQNSYVVLAHILSSYLERCIELSKQKREKAFKTILKRTIENNKDLLKELAKL